MSRKQIENTIPVLAVSDLERSIEFFHRILGFEVEWNAGPICSVGRDGSSNKPWAYEMKIADPDGNTIWLGAEPKAE